MKNKITYISVDCHSVAHGSVWVHRDGNPMGVANQYKIHPKSLTRYQRAVRLLNAFVERSMK